MYICVQHAQARGGCCRSPTVVRQNCPLPRKLALSARRAGQTATVPLHYSCCWFCSHRDAGGMQEMQSIQVPALLGSECPLVTVGRGTGIPQLLFCKLFVTSYTSNPQCLDFLPQWQTSLFPSLQFTAFLPSVIK